MSLLTLPNELLAETCENLSPQDLYSFSSVCKKLRQFLWSDESILTQQIWRHSREKFYPNIKSSPIIGMSEQQYIWLAALAKRCQFCKENNKGSITYWEFQIICCDNCLVERIKSHQTLVTEYNIPEDVLSTCLCLKNRGYLLSHVKLAQIEYSKAANKHSWIIVNLLKLIHQRLDIILIRLEHNYSIY